MKLYCPVLSSGKYIPTKYAGKETPGGQNISIPLTWGDVPSGTKSFAVTITEKSKGKIPVVHWVVVNIGPSTRGIREGISGIRNLLPEGSLELRNSFGALGYKGPVVVGGPAAREYVFAVYAMGGTLDLGPFSSFENFKEQLAGRVLGEDSIAAFFHR